jgi:hypothetical protein
VLGSPLLAHKAPYKLLFNHDMTSVPLDDGTDPFASAVQTRGSWKGAALILKYHGRRRAPWRMFKQGVSLRIGLRQGDMWLLFDVFVAMGIVGAPWLICSAKLVSWRVAFANAGHILSGARSPLESGVLTRSTFLVLLQAHTGGSGLSKLELK